MQTHTQIETLLPSGLKDLTGAGAEARAHLSTRLLGFWRAFGYQLASPPMAEFTDTMFAADSGGELAQNSFRVMDPVSQRPMAIRSDMTMQIARIAGSQLSTSPRPLRLSYAGHTLRMLPDVMRGSRQFYQVGLEQFGASGLNADLEIMRLALGALSEAGVSDLSIDLSAPHLLQILLDEMQLLSHRSLKRAIAHKDAAAIDALKQPVLSELCKMVGPAEAVLPALRTLSVSEKAGRAIADLIQAAEWLQSEMGETVSVTLDPMDMSGFGYHTGLGFAIYARQCLSQLGRGGRYETAHGEPATGFTLYAEDVVPLLPALPSPARLAIPPRCDLQTASRWRAKGYETLYATDEPAADYARRTGCSHWLDTDLITIHEV